MTFEGSSLDKYQPAAGPPRDNMDKGILSSNCTTNNFCNFTVVYLMYCDGSSFSGSREAAFVTSSGKQIWSRGKHNLDALFDRLLTRKYGFGMADATRVIVTGASAGGFMSVYHCDYIRTLLPPKAPLHCVPDCAFWPRTSDLLGQPHWEAVMRQMVDLHNSSGGLDASCVAEHPEDASYCAHPPNVLPYIETPTFISTSRQDTAATGDILVHGPFPPSWNASERAAMRRCSKAEYAACDALGRPFMDAWTDTIDALLEPARKSGGKHGYYVNNCYRHHNIDGAEAFATKIGGVSLVDAVASWALGLPGPTQVTDSSVPGSNPTCHLK